MPSILVTGGAGYIGAHVCKLLSLGGFTPVTLDDLSTGHKSAVRWGPLIEGSICDRELLKATRLAYSFEAVIHMAALSDVAKSVREPEKYASVNANGSRLIDEVFWNIPIVFSSSAAVYGSSDRPLSEDSKTNPANPYGQSKLYAEHWLTGIHNRSRLRYFNVSGCDLEIGMGHKPQTHLIPHVLQAAQNGSVFKVYGDGSAVRDFVDVRDVARANYAAMVAMFGQSIGPHTVNICGGRGYSVADVIRMATKVTGRKLKVTAVSKRQGDPDKVVGKNALAADLLSWYPKHSLEEQMAACWALMCSERAAA